MKYQSRFLRWLAARLVPYMTVYLDAMIDVAVRRVLAEKEADAFADRIIRNAEKKHWPGYIGKP